ncbi:MAG TPA: DUF2892 domain-containing protein [Flavobacteriaceae bacterium]|nr:DUF2892 domain-containing protein [Flavobacteriaceae bacterium]
MKRNMGNVDRIIRILVAIIIVYLYVTEIVSGISGVILLLLAGTLVLTSLISFCPLYGVFGLSTRKRKHI